MATLHRYDEELSDLCTNEKRVLHAGMFGSPKELVRDPTSSTHYDANLVICARSREYRSYTNIIKNGPHIISWNTMWWKPCADRIVDYLLPKIQARDYSSEYHVVFGLACGYTRLMIRNFLWELPLCEFTRVFSTGSALFHSLLKDDDRT